jgi:hypothetical protein
MYTMRLSRAATTGLESAALAHPGFAPHAPLLMAAACRRTASAAARSSTGRNVVATYAPRSEP